MRVGPRGSTPWDALPRQSLAALLALVGAKRMDVEALRTRTKLTALAFADLLDWLRRERLVDVVSSPRGGHLVEEVELTETGESTLISLLEMTCELPEFR